MAFWRRPNAEPLDVDDEVLSSIGRDLLTLAERATNVQTTARQTYCDPLVSV
jgi:hypothetical protein